MRILNGGTGATTRVLIESRDGKGNRWFTVGVSPNIVDASFQALSDSIVYKLMREGVAADLTCVIRSCDPCRGAVCVLPRRMAKPAAMSAAEQTA